MVGTGDLAPVMPGMGPTMREFKKGTLHSGSKKGPRVKSRKQAIAIGLNSERKMGGQMARHREIMKRV